MEFGNELRVNYTDTKVCPSPRFGTSLFTVNITKKKLLYDNLNSAERNFCF